MTKRLNGVKKSRLYMCFKELRAATEVMRVTKPDHGDDLAACAFFGLADGLGDALAHLFVRPIHLPTP